MDSRERRCSTYTRASLSHLSPSSTASPPNARAALAPLGLLGDCRAGVSCALHGEDLAEGDPPRLLPAASRRTPPAAAHSMAACATDGSGLPFLSLGCCGVPVAFPGVISPDDGTSVSEKRTGLSGPVTECSSVRRTVGEPNFSPLGGNERWSGEARASLGDARDPGDAAADVPTAGIER